MSIKKLGRNLETLLAGSSYRPGETVAVDTTSTHTLPVTSLQRGQYQPRRDMREEQLQELANSIKAQGIIQPIVVRRLASGQYEIIAGERRWRAAQMAGLSEVPVVVKDLSDEETLAVSLIENIQRADLNPLEEAIALQRLANEFNLTHDAVASSVGRSRVGVSNLLRLLTLNPEVKTLLEHGDLEMGHARALLSLKGEAQTIAAQTVVNRGLSVRETEEFVRKLLTGGETKKVTPALALDPDTQRLQQRLSDLLGAAVSIQMQKGRGKLIISYHSLDELDGILAHIK